MQIGANTSMNLSNRRRSSRLRKLHVERVDDDLERIGGGRGKDTSSKRKSTATNLTTQTRALQGKGHRRKRSSDSESSAFQTTDKPRKRTRVSKSKLSISTNTNDCTATTTRRKTRSSTKQAQRKNVTPSPVAPTHTAKFLFTSARKAARRRSGSRGHNDGDDRRYVPLGVVNLYRDQEKEMGASPGAFESPTNLSIRKRRTLKRQGKEQQEHKRSESRSCSMLSTIGGYPFSSSTPESATIDYIRMYGEDYWGSLHDSERPIICDPSLLKSSNKNNNGRPNTKTANTKSRSNKKGTYIPFGSPASRGSSHSSSTSSSSPSKVTPGKKRTFDDPWVATNFNWIRQKKNPQPHQSHESTKPMSVQPQLTPKMRSILVDWLIELSEHFSFESSTLHLAVTMVDRVLASGQLLEPDNSKTSSRSPERRRLRSRSVSARATKADSSIDDCDTSESFFNESDVESDDDESEEDNKSKDTRCYIIPRDRFQLLGATCVWLACKVQETAHPKAKDVAYVSDHIYSIEQIKRMEKRICNALNFSFYEVPTPHQFLFEFMRASLAGHVTEEKEQKWSIPAAATGVGLSIDSVFRDMAHYLLELGRLPYAPTGRNPSLLAAAAVYLARVTLGIARALKDGASAASHSSYLASSMSDSDSDSSLDPLWYYWTPTLKHYTGYTQSDLRETVLQIHEYQSAAESSALKAVFNKYKSKKYHRVALKTVALIEDLGFS